MKLQRLETKPRNPKHFLRLLFRRAKNNPQMRDKNEFLVLSKDMHSKALFRCAYGYFWVSKDREVLSGDFLEGQSRL